MLIEREAIFKTFVEAEDDQIRNVHGFAEIAWLDGGEARVLMKRFVEIKS